MRKRYQEGRLRKVNGSWIAQWWEDGHRRKRTLGQVSKLSKTDARAQLVAILSPINARVRTPSAACSFSDFMEQVYLPFYRRKWKGSTAECNEYRLRFHLTNEFGSRTIGSFSRDELQTLLDQKTADGLSYSTVAHLRWDLSQIFKMAVAEGYVLRSPAALLFVPREAPRPSHRTLTIEEVRTVLSVLELRERVIAGLAIIAGMRPGEIFGLTRGQLEREYANVQQQVYRGVVGTPKTFNSRRWAALSEGVLKWIASWLEFVPDERPEA